MFGSLGGAEIALILVLALLLFGPRKLPQIGRTLGKSLSEFRRATHDFKLNLEQEVRLEEARAAQPPAPDAQSESGVRPVPQQQPQQPPQPRPAPGDDGKQGDD